MLFSRHICRTKRMDTMNRLRSSPRTLLRSYRSFQFSGSTEYHLSTATVISDDLAQIFHAYSSPWIPSAVNSTLCIPAMAPTVSLVLVSFMWGVHLGNRLPSTRSRQISMIEFRPLQPYLPLTVNSGGFRIGPLAFVLTIRRRSQRIHGPLSGTLAYPMGA